jgi:hypothetical protein
MVGGLNSTPGDQWMHILDDSQWLGDIKRFVKISCDINISINK